MNKSLKFLLLIAPLALCGCDFNLSSLFNNKESEGTTNEVTPNGNTSGGQTSSETTPSEGTSTETQQSTNDPSTTDPGTIDPGTTDPGTIDPGTTDPGTTDPDPVTPSTPVITDKIEGMTMSCGFVTVKKGKYEYVTVDIEYVGDYDWQTAGDEIAWTTSDPSIATVNENGKVVGVSKGHTKLTATLKVSHHTCSTSVYVIESDSDITKTWKKMGGNDVINDNDSIIIACSQESKAATGVDTGMKLHSTNISLSSDKSVITNIGDAAEFYVYRDSKGRDGYNFELLSNGKYLGTSNTSKVSYFDSAKSSQTVWSVEYDTDNNCWDMRSATNIDGWMMYNKDLGQFATYQSNETANMFVVSLYRLTYTYNI